MTHVTADVRDLKATIHRLSNRLAQQGAEMNILKCEIEMLLQKLERSDRKLAVYESQHNPARKANKC